MTIRDAAGAVLNKAGLEGKTTVVTQPTIRQISEDIYETFTAPGRKEKDADRRLKFKTGQVVQQAEIDALFKLATFTSITPASGPIAGNTNVTIKGTELLGVTAVTIGGTAVTNLVIVDENTITCTTPAGTAGAKNVVITDDGGPVTATNAYTYV